MILDFSARVLIFWHPPNSGYQTWPTGKGKDPQTIQAKSVITLSFFLFSYVLRSTVEGTYTAYDKSKGAFLVQNLLSPEHRGKDLDQIRCQITQTAMTSQMASFPPIRGTDPATAAELHTYEIPAVSHNTLAKRLILMPDQP